MARNSFSFCARLTVDRRAEVSEINSVEHEQEQLTLFALGEYTVRTVGEDVKPGPDDGVRLFAPEVNE